MTEVGVVTLQISLLFSKWFLSLAPHTYPFSDSVAWESILSSVYSCIR